MPSEENLLVATAEARKWIAPYFDSAARHLTLCGPKLLWLTKTPIAIIGCLITYHQNHLQAFIRRSSSKLLDELALARPDVGNWAARRVVTSSDPQSPFLARQLLFRPVLLAEVFQNNYQKPFPRRHGMKTPSKKEKHSSVFEQTHPRPSGLRYGGQTDRLDGH